MIPYRKYSFVGFPDWTVKRDTEGYYVFDPTMNGYNNFTWQAPMLEQAMISELGNIEFTQYSIIGVCIMRLTARQKVHFEMAMLER